MPLQVTMDVPGDPEFIQCAVEGLTALSYCYMHTAMRLGTPFPRLYESGIVYRREHGTEDWQHAAKTLRLGWGDCEDLAAYRAAELRCEGEPAIVHIITTDRGTYHAIVQHADGTLEDPSRICIQLELARRQAEETDKG